MDLTDYIREDAENRFDELAPKVGETHVTMQELEQVFEEMDNGHSLGSWDVGSSGVTKNSNGTVTRHLTLTVLVALLGNAAADTCLIAAAPRMLEALEDVAAWLVAPDLSKETINRFRSLTRAAIAAARGEKP